MTILASDLHLFRDVCDSIQLEELSKEQKETTAASLDPMDFDKLKLDFKAVLMDEEALAKHPLNNIQSMDRIHVKDLFKDPDDPTMAFKEEYQPTQRRLNEEAATILNILKETQNTFFESLGKPSEKQPMSDASKVSKDDEADRHPIEEDLNALKPHLGYICNFCDTVLNLNDKDSKTLGHLLNRIFYEN